MEYNYHTHTYRCGHADGTPREYIERALSCGIRYMGFSDHMPYRFPDGFESAHRVPVEEAKDYISELRQLREEYRGRIEIAIGFEMEYYPHHFKTMLENVRAYGCEYLILGQHYIYEEHPDGISGVESSARPEDLADYVSGVLGAMESGCFSYVAHPDFYFFVGSETLYREQMRKICVAAREKNIPLEINFLGIRQNRIYPRELFWELAGEEGSPVTFGFDAHTTMHAYDGESLVKAEELVKKYSLNYIGRPRLIPIRQL